MEGEIITRLENEMSEGKTYDMKKYIDTAEEIAERKLQMYTDLLNKIKEFRTSFL